MKTSGIVAAAAILLQSQQVQASPITNLVTRGKADIVLAILKVFGVIFPDAEAETTWSVSQDYDRGTITRLTKPGTLRSILRCVQYTWKPRMGPIARQQSSATMARRNTTPMVSHPIEYK
jgi:hypothetical protein